MPALQALYARYRDRAGALASASHPSAPAGARQAVREALGGLEAVVTGSCADALTQDGVTTYALALVQLRECAATADCRRLVAACDALSVTVARLIENRESRRHEACASLARFVTHARAMVEMEAGAHPADACQLGERQLGVQPATLQ